MGILKRVVIAGFVFVLIVMLIAPFIPDEPGAAEEQGYEIGRAFAAWTFSCGVCGDRYGRCVTGLVGEMV